MLNVIGLTQDLAERGNALHRRNEIDLCSKLLGLSAYALHDNWGLIPFVIATQIMSALISLVLLAFTLFAYEHGNVVPNRASFSLPRISASPEIAAATNAV